MFRLRESHSRPNPVALKGSHGFLRGETDEPSNDSLETVGETQLRYVPIIPRQ